MSLADRDGVLDTATRFMARHGNDVSLFEAYLLLVIPAYKAGIFVMEELGQISAISRVRWRRCWSRRSRWRSEVPW